jgi:hemoglobin
MSRFTPLALLMAGALVLGAGVGCGKDEDKRDKRMDAKMSTKDASGRTLWERLGGKPAVEAVVDEFVNTAAGDPKVNFVRKGTPREWEASEANVKKLKRRLVEFISENTGGPLKYQGRDMVSSHANMNISNAEFDALAGHLVKALDKFKVEQKEKDELMKIIDSTRPQIVGK